MLLVPNGPVLPALAGPRVRPADLVVEAASRAPLCEVRSAFARLPVDGGGRIGPARSVKQRWGRAEAALDRGLGVRDHVDLFIAQGRARTTSNAPARALGAAALAQTCAGGPVAGRDLVPGTLRYSLPRSTASHT